MVFRQWFPSQEESSDDKTPWWEQVSDSDPDTRQQGYQQFQDFADMYSPQQEEEEENE